MTCKKKTPDVLAIEKLLKSGWTKVIILGVRPDGKVTIAHNDLSPVVIVGLIECTKMMTVRTWAESGDQITKAQDV